jgi:ribosome-binding protein aMBF1 (putative translation factor)
MKARKYQSEEIDEIFESISPVEIEQSKIKMQISVKIEEIMKLKGISKSELANKANKQPSVINRLKND